MKRTKLIWIMISTLAQLSCRLSNESNSLPPTDSLANSASPSEVITALSPTEKPSSKQRTKDGASGKVAPSSAMTSSDSLSRGSSNSQDHGHYHDEKTQSAVGSDGQQLPSIPAQSSIQNNPSMVNDVRSVSQGVASSKGDSAASESKNSEHQKSLVSQDDEDCRPLKISGMPQWFDDEKVFLTRVSKPCITSSGEPGSEFSSHWVTMGISCSGGENRFRWLENYLDPKQVNLDFGMNCPMSLNWGDVSQALSSKTGLVGSKMIAYNPMAVVYWELEETGEKDTGSLIKIKNVKDLRPFWREFIMKGKPLSLKLVGYESAWTEVRQYFQISAKITKASKNTFKLNIQEAKPLGTKELAVFQSQCEQLVPRRDCDRVF